eukprot:2759807-Amphidinium_carterae.1
MARRRFEGQGLAEVLLPHLQRGGLGWLPFYDTDVMRAKVDKAKLYQAKEVIKDLHRLFPNLTFKHSSLVDGIMGALSVVQDN